MCVCIFIYLYIYSHHLNLDLAFFSQNTQSPLGHSRNNSNLQASVLCVYDSSSPLRAPDCLSLDSCNVNMGVFSTTWEALLCLRNVNESCLCNPFMALLKLHLSTCLMWSASKGKFIIIFVSSLVWLQWFSSVLFLMFGEALVSASIIFLRMTGGWDKQEGERIKLMNLWRKSSSPNLQFSVSFS